MQNKFTIEQVKKHWDLVANKYEKSHEKSIKETHFQRFEKAIEYFSPKPEMKILNIWSRTGEAIPYIKKTCPDAILYNLEVSGKFINIAKNNFPAEKFQQTDLTNLLFKNNYFDYILSLETLEHAPNPLKLLEEFYRTLKPNGILIMSCPPQTAELPSKLYQIFFYDHGEGPHKFLSTKNVKKLIQTSKLKLLEHRGTLLIPIGPKFFKNFGEKIIIKFQKTFIKEFGIRQFYICKKI